MLACGLAALGSQPHRGRRLEATLAPEEQVTLSSNTTYSGKTLFEHVHLPKTGGTTVSNVLVSVFCANTTKITNVGGWSSRCSVDCERSDYVIDTEFACAPTPYDRVEHALFDKQRSRTVKRAKYLNIAPSETVYVTTIRSAAARSISHWSHCISELSHNGRTQCGFEKQDDNMTTTLTNETLSHFMNTYKHGGTWVPWFRTYNMQVGMLASVKNGVPVTSDDLEIAKQRLSEGRWLAYTFGCLPRLYKHFAKKAGLSFDKNQTYEMTSSAHHTNATLSMYLSSDALQDVEEGNKLDDQLYRWVLEREENKNLDQSETSTPDEPTVAEAAATCQRDELQEQLGETDAHAEAQRSELQITSREELLQKTGKWLNVPILQGLD